MCDNFNSMPDPIKNFINQCKYNLLKTNKDGVKSAFQYLKDRELNYDLIDSLDIGYCLIKQNIPEEICFFGNNLLPQGLERDLSYNIRDRIMLPIYGENGNFEGLATRVPHPSYKWWNLPNPFEKTKVLYLLNLARSAIFKENKVYVVEGYMDAITLYKNGIKNVVAIMGTSFTLRHVGLLLRYCDRICFCFDCDKNGAGQKATAKAFSLVNSLGVFDEVSVINDMGIGYDPDGFVKEFGPEKFLSLEKEITPMNADAILNPMDRVEVKS